MFIPSIVPQKQGLESLLLRESFQTLGNNCECYYIDGQAELCDIDNSNPSRMVKFFIQCFQQLRSRA